METCPDSRLLSRAAALLDNKRFELIVLPTEKCNFRCSYCYEDFTIGRMSDRTVEGLKKLITTRVPELNFLDLSWFGGEPLTAISTVLDIAGHACRVIAETNQDCGYRGSMTTNGYLLDSSLLHKLWSVGIHNFQISLDGPREKHDTMRVTKAGQGTFSRIWQNLLSIKASNLSVHVTIRVHVTPRNVAIIEPFLEQLNLSFCDDTRFRLFLKPIDHLGGSNDSAFDILSPKQRASLFKHKSNGQRKNEEESRQTEQLAGPVCYAAKANSLIIRADGSVAKCTVALRDPRNAIGRLTGDGQVLINSSKLRPWLRGIPNLEESVLCCPLSGMGEVGV